MIVNGIGMVLLVIGTFLHMWTAKLLGVGIIGVPEIFIKIKENTVTEGPFSLVRHPTYLSHTLIFSGAFLITGVFAVGMLTILDFLIINSIVIPLEEKELLFRFSGEYVQYKKKVPSRFFPWIY
jgi:protein-S-isoprenylcysteine O-methyltransferase Ste14